MDGALIAFVLGFVALAGLIGWSAHRRLEAFRAAVAHTARALGLGFDRGRWGRTPTATGLVDGLAIDVRFVRRRPKPRRGRDDSPVLFTLVRVSGAWGPELSALPRATGRPRRGFFAALGDGLGRRAELPSGDPALDAAVSLRAASPTDLRARLDAPTRALLLALVGHPGPHADGRVDKGTLTVARRGLVTDPEALADFARAAADLGRGLQRRGAAAEDALAAIAATDPLPALRLGAFDALTAAHPRHRATARALARALQDPDPHLRVRAAEHAADGAFEVARDLALDPSAPPEPRVRALRLLGARYPRRGDEAARALAEALETAAGPALAAACAAATDRAVALPLAPLGAALARLGDPAATAAPYADALACHGAAAEGPLLALLAHPDPDARAAAARALGQVAGLGAVAPLLPHATGVFKSRTLKAAAREAIASIQARAGGAGPGALSLAEPQGGALSLADEDG